MSSSSSSSTKLALGAGVALLAGSLGYFMYRSTSTNGQKQQVEQCGDRRCESKQEAGTGAESTAALESFPVFDISEYLSGDTKSKEKWERDCKAIAQNLHKYGLLIIKDPVRPTYFFVLQAVSCAPRCLVVATAFDLHWWSAASERGREREVCRYDGEVF